MSIEAMNWALATKVGSPTTKAVLMILANRADHQGRCWPGIDGIAEQTEISRRSVIRHIKILEQGGFLEVEHRGGTGEGRKSNVYLLNVRQCAKLAQSKKTAVSNGLGDKLAQRGNVPTVQGQCDNGAGLSDTVTPEPSINPQRTHKVNGAKKIDWSKIPGLNLEAWAVWLEDRKLHKRPQYKTTIEAERLAALPGDAQLECVKHSLDRYVGLFPEKFASQAGAGTPSKSKRGSFDSVMERLGQ